MDQTVKPTEIDKEAEIGDLADPSAPDLPGFEIIEQIVPTGRAPLLRRCTLRENQALSAPIDLDHLDHDLVINHRA